MPRLQWLAEAWCLKFDTLSSMVLDIIRAFPLMEIVDYTKCGSLQGYLISVDGAFGVVFTTKLLNWNPGVILNSIQGTKLFHLLSSNFKKEHVTATLVIVTKHITTCEIML